MKKLIEKFKGVPTAISLPITVMMIGTLIPVTLSGTENFSLYFIISCYVMMMAILAVTIKRYIENTNDDDTTTLVKKKLVDNLDNKIVYLVDYENSQHLPKEIKETGIETVYLIFYNQMQRERLMQEVRMLSTQSRIEMYCSSHSNKNLLDIGIGMYVGAIYALYSPQEIRIYSEDKGYQSLIQISEDFGYFNLYNVSPKQNSKVPPSKQDKIYRTILKNTNETKMSLGNFKKKIRKSTLDINPDEVNFVVKGLEERGRIILHDIDGSKQVELIRV